MNKQNSIKFNFRPVLKEGWLHQTQLHSAWERVVNFPAIKIRAIQELNYVEIQAPGQLVFCFRKLQDTVGLRLSPAILARTANQKKHEYFLKPAKW